MSNCLAQPLSNRVQAAHPCLRKPPIGCSDGLSPNFVAAVIGVEYGMARTSFDLVEPYIPSLRRYALVLLRYDEQRADDLVQDCLLRALSRWHLWRHPGNLRGWLFTILHNIYVNDVARAASRPDVVEIQDYFPAMAVPANQTHSIQLKEAVRAIQGLPDTQRQTLLLVTMEGFSYDETAEITGVPIGTVMSRLSRARDKVREEVSGEDRTRGRSAT